MTSAFWSDLAEKFGLMFLGLAVFAAAVGFILFLADRAPKRGRDIWQLLGFLAPAMILLGVGLVYPAINT
ncbi:MAG: sugar ABC transporter permease, partial [Microcella sp.]|nr:sugar ABC transporter permease [Microcella sp.]